MSASYQTELNESIAPLRVERGNVIRMPLGASSFAAQLCHERRRVERSGRTIVLFLVDCAHPAADHSGHGLRLDLLKALCDSMRLTDTVGWHVDNQVIGIIVTEFGKSDVWPAVKCIQSRITATLSSVLGAEVASQLDILVQFFPLRPIYESAGKLDLTFYPEAGTRNAATDARFPLKRLIDVTCSSIALVALSPVFALISLAIRLTSPGPAIFRQERVGQFGVPFTMYKFRSMRTAVDSHAHRDYVRDFISGKAKAEDNGGLFKLTKDPRITPLGKFLRSTSLDELPQFLNVLMGKMSLVGPRPPLRYEIEAYEPWHMRRILDAKPGLTGLWQVTARSKTGFDDMVRLDLRYALQRSLALDFKLLVKTLRVLISDEGAC